ncbi:hypothetical protein OP10G_1446 [Fimbriimonas ginsengisoli Gsoil 348]|uniref:Uncharacterized protein n=1 Tax=Fimbriimonas ginsengisoli Gsoil 348 TaxID=661478 RepID=A0A068NT56_FIMGI|nr:hypothetical protein OP10G_1446 [Fimbriimonas ginsengisoli Gsoil 348]
MAQGVPAMAFFDNKHAILEAWGRGLVDVRLDRGHLKLVSRIWGDAADPVNSLIAVGPRNGFFALRSGVVHTLRFTGSGWVVGKADQVAPFSVLIAVAGGLVVFARSTEKSIIALDLKGRRIGAFELPEAGMFLVPIG